jgi:hypothetical protein
LLFHRLPQDPKSREGKDARSLRDREDLTLLAMESQSSPVPEEALKDRDSLKEL